MSEVGTEASRKRRRRRRRGKGAEQPPAQQVAANVAAVTPRAPGTVAISCELPARFAEILTWAARANGLPVPDMVAQILRGVLSGMKPAWREAMTGSAGATAAKGAATDRLLERKRPSSI